MIALDTNVLVRYLVRDDKAQAKIAAAYIDQNCNKSSPGFIPLLVLAEIVWVLQRFYKFNRQEITQYLDAILSAQEFEVENPAIAAKSLLEYKGGSADFSDYLIKNSARASDAKPLVTFDKRAGDEAGFHFLERE